MGPMYIETPYIFALEYGNFLTATFSYFWFYLFVCLFIYLFIFNAVEFDK